MRHIASGNHCYCYYLVQFFLKGPVRGSLNLCYKLLMMFSDLIILLFPATYSPIPNYRAGKNISNGVFPNRLNGEF